MNFKKSLVIVSMIALLASSSGGALSTSAEELSGQEISANITSTKKSEVGFITTQEFDVEVVEGEGVVSPRATLVDQNVSFKSEGSAFFTYRGGKSLEITIKNGGATSFKWKIIDPKGNAFHTGTLASGKEMKYIYPDFETPNGRYSVYMYNNGEDGLAELFVRSIEH